RFRGFAARGGRRPAGGVSLVHLARVSSGKARSATGNSHTVALVAPLRGEGAKDGRAAALVHAGSGDLSDAGAPELPEDRRGGGLRRRWDPRQSDDLSRHLRHAWSGGSADLSHATLPGGDATLHSSRLGARGREPDGRRDRPGSDEGDYRLGLYVG